MSLVVTVDPSALIFRTTIETLAGVLLLYLVFTQKKWATVFLELSIAFAVADRTLLFIGPNAIFTHDVLTTASSIMILLTVIARILETDNIINKYKEILKMVAQENKDEIKHREVT